eukprot:GHVH01003627.1.p1 GENE.GHVH01003627.1~~GHVH01003627.1.p1  ORF type:complete len:290 (+),score=42.77 GHVH01003627.1:37-906(+)
MSLLLNVLFSSVIGIPEVEDVVANMKEAGIKFLVPPNTTDPSRLADLHFITNPIHVHKPASTSTSARAFILDRTRSSRRIWSEVELWQGMTEQEVNRLAPEMMNEARFRRYGTATDLEYEVDEPLDSYAAKASTASIYDDDHPRLWDFGISILPPMWHMHKAALKLNHRLVPLAETSMQRTTFIASTVDLQLSPELIWPTIDLSESKKLLDPYVDDSVKNDQSAYGEVAKSMVDKLTNHQWDVDLVPSVDLDARIVEKQENYITKSASCHDECKDRLSGVKACQKGVRR